MIGIHIEFCGGRCNYRLCNKFTILHEHHKHKPSGVRHVVWGNVVSSPSAGPPMNFLVYTDDVWASVNRLKLVVSYSRCSSALTRSQRGWKQTGCSWILPRPKSSGAHQHGVNTWSRKSLCASAMPQCRRSLQSGILLTSLWGPMSPTPSERVLQHCVRLAACDGLFLYTPRWHYSPSTSDQVGPVQLGSSGYFSVSAGPTAVSAQCRRSARLLMLIVRAHNSIASGTTLVTHPVSVMYSGISLCAWHSTSTSVSGRQPAADIRFDVVLVQSRGRRCWCRQLVAQFSATARFLWLQRGHGTVCQHR